MRDQGDERNTVSQMAPEYYDTLEIASIVSVVSVVLLAAGAKQ